MGGWPRGALLLHPNLPYQRLRKLGSHLREACKMHVNRAFRKILQANCEQQVMLPRRIGQVARQPLRPGSPLTCRPSLVIAMSSLAIGCLPTTLVRGQLVPLSQWERISHAQWTFA